MPLAGDSPRQVASRLGMFFEPGPERKSSLLPSVRDHKLDDMKVLVGVYAEGEEPPNSGGVIDLGLY